MSIISGKRNLKFTGGYVLAGQLWNRLTYFLTDGIYPEWSVFLKLNHVPTTAKERDMTKAQQVTQKYVELLFGVLQGRLLILRREFHSWSDDKLIEVMHVGIILHNILVRLRVIGELEDETDEEGMAVRPHEIIKDFYKVEEEDEESENGSLNGTDDEKSIKDQSPRYFQRLISCKDSISDLEARRSLRGTTKDHVWSTSGHQYIA